MWNWGLRVACLSKTPWTCLATLDVPVVFYLIHVLFFLILVCSVSIHVYLVDCRFMSSQGNKRVELFDMGAGASEPTAEDNVQLASGELRSLLMFTVKLQFLYIKKEGFIEFGKFVWTKDCLFIVVITKKNRKGSILIMILFPSLNVILYDFRFSANCLIASCSLTCQVTLFLNPKFYFKISAMQINAPAIESYLELKRVG